MKKLIVYTTLALLLIVGSYQLVFAKPGRGNDQERGYILSQAIGYVEKLKLTEEQVSKISVLIQKDNTTSKMLFEKMQASRSVLRELEWSKSFVQANVDKLIKEITDTRTTMQANRQKLYTDINTLLTVDQQKLFADLGFGCGSGSCGQGGCGNGGCNR